MFAVKCGRNPAPKAPPGLAAQVVERHRVSWEGARARRGMWLEGEGHEQERKMLQSCGEEELERGLSLGW